MMMPSSLGGSSGGAKHHQQLVQSASMLPSPYSFLPSVFANAQLDMPLFRPPESNLGAMYLSQLAAAALNQSQNGSNSSTTSEQQEETVNKNNKTEMAASTSSEKATSPCGADSPLSPKPFGTMEQEMESANERNSGDNVALSPMKINTEDMAMAENENLQPSSASELQQLDLSKWISDFFPGLPNNVSALNMAALTQRMPPVLEQVQLMNQYFSPGSVEDSLRVLAALGSTSGSTATISQNLPLDLPTTSTGMNLSPAELIAALCNQNVLEASQISPSKTTSSQPTSVIVNCLSSADSSPTKRARTIDERNKDDDDLIDAARTESDRIDEEALASVASQLPNTGDLFALIARQAQENAIAQELLSSLKAEEIQAQQQSSPSKHSAISKEACEMCGQECESRATLQHHLLLQHNILNSFLNSFSLLSPLGQLHPQQQSQKQQNNQNNDIEQSRNSTVVPAMITSPVNVSRQPKKQYTTTGKNYCDVCNKEVCNKYFLRTHMLKMHGIVIDEHKTIIANIDTLEKEKSGTIAFRCDICNTNVGQTRESLKQHKQEIHNVVSLPTSRGHRGSLSSTSSITSTSALSQTLKISDQSGNHIDQLRCPLCDVRTVGVAAMQKHLSEKHTMDMSLESLEGFLKDAYEIKTEQSAALSGSLATNLEQQITTERGEFTCIHCSDVFNDQIQFQLHMIHNHSLVIRSPEDASSTAITAHNMEPLCTHHSLQSSSITDSWANSDEKHRSTEDMKEDETLGDEGHQIASENVRKFFDCPISWCSRRYRDPIILSKHVSIVHQWRLKFSRKNGKKKSRIIAPRCKYRFWSRDVCEKHLLWHVGRQTNGKTVSKEPIVNGATENGRSQEVSKFTGVKEGKIIVNVGNGSGRKEQERSIHDLYSPDSDAMPEGHGQSSTNRKPYTVQTFLVREQTSQPSSSTKNATAAVGVVFDEMIAHLPVRNTVQEMVRVNVELVPASLQVSPILHL